MVATMRGPVPADELGRTLMHEHVFVLTADVQANFPGEFSAEAQIPAAISKLQEVAAAGISTIVDPTVVGLGRDIPRLARIAAEVDLNIIVATGIYTYNEAPYFFRYRGPILGLDAPDPMVEMFISDIVDGIAGTSVRAGLLKCAIDEPGMTAGVERILRAVALAHLETGVPVMVHTHPRSETGSLVHSVLASLGVPPSRVVLAHSGDSTDADHLSSLASLGYVLGMDRFGLYLDATFDERIGIVVELCRRGFASQLVLSQDAACYIDWVDPPLLPMLPDWHYLHVVQDVVPALLERGVTQSQVDEMLIHTPARIFS